LRQNWIKEMDTTDLIGESEAIRWLKGFIAKIAPLESNVLITGPSGSGTELVSRMIHAQSKRGSGPFVRLNFGSLPEEFVEAELFGAVKGSVKGLDEEYQGKIESAHRGTVLFDEIVDIPLKVQARLLGFAEHKQIEKIGQKEPIAVDARIIATSNRNLPDLIEERKFREDLYYRLNVVSVHVPPLRDRLEDLPLLLRHFLREISHKLGKNVNRASREAMGVFVSHDWPGNTRELVNVLERAMILSEGDTLDEKEVRMALQSSFGASRSDTQLIQPARLSGDGGIPLKEVVQQVEKDCIVRALLRTNGVQAEAAEILGLNPKNLWKKIQKHSIKIQTLMEEGKSDSGSREEKVVGI
jgi:two-component system response regulator AtoC